MIKKMIPEVAGLLLILLFGYAAMNKLLVYDKFVVQIAQSPILEGISPWLAWMVPAVELAICVLLLMPAWRRMGLYASTILMTVFTLYIMFILWFSPEVPCSCGGILNQLDWKSHLVFNIIFTGIAAAGLMYEKNYNYQV